MDLLLLLMRCKLSPLVVVSRKEGESRVHKPSIFSEPDLSFR